MNKKFILILTLFLPVFIYAHTLLLNVFDNEDNTITIEGVFNTGQKAVGALVKLESLVSGNIIYKKRLPDKSEVTIPIPNEEYQIVLDGGPGHIIIQKGIVPLDGFKIKASKDISPKISKPKQNNKDLGLSLIILFSIAFLLFGLTLYFSSKNTNKILTEMRKQY